MIMLSKKTKPPARGVSSKKHGGLKDVRIDSILSYPLVNVKIKTWLNNELPHNIYGPAVYIVLDSNSKPLYVGIVHSENRPVRKRIHEHLAPRNLHYNTPLGWFVQQNLPQSLEWSLLILKAKGDIFETEKSLIRELKPRINYFYHPDKLGIPITQHRRMVVNA